MKLVLAVLAMCLVGCGKTKTCYWCKESIKEAALICKHCGKEPKEPEAAKERRLRDLGQRRCSFCEKWFYGDVFVSHQSTCLSRPMLGLGQGDDKQKLGLSPEELRRTPEGRLVLEQILREEFGDAVGRDKK